jgi:hypothetical protein
MWATLTAAVTPFSRTTSWLQSNWQASPGANDNGTKAGAVRLACSRCQLRA